MFIFSLSLLDISDCAVVVLSESVEKHDRNVYEMGADNLSNEQRAAVFSKVLGKSITYEQQPLKDFYKTMIGSGMSHSFTYDILSVFASSESQTPTPQVAILINRPLRTLEEWLKENVTAFQ